MLVKLLPFCLSLIFIISFIPPSEAHLTHTPRYNGGSQLSNGYMLILATNPEYVRPGEQANLILSIQDTNGKDLQAVKTEIKIFKDEQLVKDFPLFVHPTGDFKESYAFSEAGIYQVEIDVYGSKESPYSGGDPEATASYNIFVSEWSGQIINGVLAVSIVMPVAVLGLVLGLRAKARAKSNMRLEKDALIQYVAVLSAIAAGTMHTVLFADHSEETIYYGIFFIVAGFSQLSYGVLYMMFKRKLLNYIGLVGTIGIIGLYIYSVILPPPFHPSPAPEQAEIIGFAVKAMESILLISLIYLINKERRHDLKISSADQNF